MENVLTKTEVQLCLRVCFCSFDISELMINSPRTLNEIPSLSSLRSQAYGARSDGAISVLALSTRREWKQRPELPLRYSGRGSWWSGLSCSVRDISSVKKTSCVYPAEAKQKGTLRNAEMWQWDRRTYLLITLSQVLKCHWHTSAVRFKNMGGNWNRAQK